MTSHSSRRGLTPPDPAAERHWVCATRLRERRRTLGLTQADVAVLLAGRGVLLSNRTLSAMENGRGLDLGRLPDLAAALDCTITYLIGLTDDPHRWQPDEPPAVPDLGTPHRNWILGPVSAAAVPPAAPPRSGPLPSASLPSASLPSGPLRSGPLPSASLPSGPLRSGPLPSAPLPAGSAVPPAPDIAMGQPAPPS